METNDLFSPREGSVPAAIPVGNCVAADDGMLLITRMTTPPQLVLAGDIDDACISFLTARLAEAAGRSGEVHIDLAGVDYCGLPGLRILIGLGDGDDQHHLPGRLILHHLPAHLNEVLRVLGWEAVPGLTIASTSASAAASG